MFVRPVCILLSLVLLAHQPSDGGIIFDKISSFVNKFVPLQRTTTTLLLPTTSTTPAAAAMHGHGDNSTNVLPPTASEIVGGNSTLPVTPLPDDVTTASSNDSKSFIIAPNLAKCGSGFRVGHNGRCYRIV